MSEPTAYQKIRAEILCGKCQSGKFMFWQEHALEADTQLRGSIKDKASGLVFLVRCEFFRVTVQSPRALTHCEGLKKKGT